jgi:hypothetical protein
MIIIITKYRGHLLNIPQSACKTRETKIKPSIVRQITIATDIFTNNGEINNVITNNINITIYYSHDLETQGAVKITLDLI